MRLRGSGSKPQKVRSSAGKGGNTIFPLWGSSSIFQVYSEVVQDINREIRSAEFCLCRDKGAELKRQSSPITEIHSNHCLLSGAVGRDRKKDDHRGWKSVNRIWCWHKEFLLLCLSTV